MKNLEEIMEENLQGKKIGTFYCPDEFATLSISVDGQREYFGLGLRLGYPEDDFFVVCADISTHYESWKGTFHVHFHELKILAEFKLGRMKPFKFLKEFLKNYPTAVQLRTGIVNSLLHGLAFKPTKQS